MAGSIFSAGAGLFAAVSVAYLVTWYTSGGDLLRAQTVAFVSWMLGHVFLAINLRSEREPLFRLGFFSNRLMILWPWRRSPSSSLRPWSLGCRTSSRRPRSAVRTGSWC